MPQKNSPFRVEMGRNLRQRSYKSACNRSFVTKPASKREKFCQFYILLQLIEYSSTKGMFQYKTYGILIKEGISNFFLCIFWISLFSIFCIFEYCIFCLFRIVQQALSQLYRELAYLTARGIRNMFFSWYFFSLFCISFLYYVFFVFLNVVFPVFSYFCAGIVATLQKIGVFDSGRHRPSQKWRRLG